jgi:hypothetical protein
LDWDALTDQSVYYASYYLTFRNPRIRTRFRDMYSRLRELLIAEIESCVRAGELSVEDPGRAADLIITLAEGLGAYENVVSDEVRSEKLRRYAKEVIVMALEIHQEIGSRS